MNAKKTDKNPSSKHFKQIMRCFYISAVCGAASIVFAGLLAGADFFILILLLIFVVNAAISIRMGHAILKVSAQISRFEEEQSAELESVRHSSQVKSDYLASMSHEIKTPLNALIGFSDLLASSALDEAQLKQVKTINSSACILLDIANDILDVSKIESGAVQLENLEFDLEYLIRTIFDICRPRLAGKSVEFKLDIQHPSLCRLKGDPTRLRQILLNLIGNATKFTDQGAIGVEVRKLRAFQNNKEDLIEFTVWDTGIGIPKNRHQIIFESFSQAATDTTRKYGGTGLGLAIVKKLVNLLGGDVKLYSKEGQGSRFVFTAQMECISTLPSQTGGTEENAVLPVAVKQLQGVQTAVISSDPLTTQTLVTLLESFGVEIVGCFAGCAEMINLIANHNGDIRIVFIEVECISRAELEQVVKRCADCKLIAVSNENLPGAASKIQAMGFDAYIGKPLKKDDVSGVMQSVLGDRRKLRTPIITRHTYSEAQFTKENRSKSLQKILVAEDNKINQELMAAYLRKLNYDFDIVSNGCEAVESVSKNLYSLIFMDLQMPEMNGVEASIQIRNHNAHIPIIALTAAGSTQDRDRCQKIGMNDFLPKPVQLKELKRKIEQWM